MGNGIADNIAELVHNHNGVIVRLHEERICRDSVEKLHQYLIDNSDIFSSKKTIIFDMQEVSHIDSYAIHELLGLQKRYSGKDLGLCNVQDHVSLLLRQVHVDRIFPCYSDLGSFEQLYNKIELNKIENQLVN